jgi:membrane-bound serine protease (ClpP class)
VLLIIGLAGIYLEFKTPGFGLPGMVGLIALMFYFFGAYISGISGLGWAIIFMVGLIFLMVEMFLVPGTLISGIVGVLLMSVALVMAMVDLYPVAPAGPPNAPDGIQTEGEQQGSEGFGFNVILPDSSSVSRAFLKLALSAVGAMGLIYFLGFLIKDTAMYNTLVSHSSSGRDQQWDSGQAAEEWVGAEGVAISPLRPGGKAKIKGKVVDVIADGQMIDAGVKIRVLRHSGMDAVVEPVEEDGMEKG